MNMRFEILQLIEPLTDATTPGVVTALKAISGVNNVATAGTRINVDFDEEVTSVQELRTVVQRSGLELKKRVHGEDGACCGSCS